MATPGAYNGPTARLCAELSKVVYDNPHDIRRRVATLLPNAKVEIHPGFDAGSRTVVVSTEDENIIIFRGTVRARRSHLVNLRCRRVWRGNGLVHSGFLSVVEQAAPFIHWKLRTHGTNAKELYFTGHSQGGAAAYLAAMRFSLRVGLPSPSAVYTFGQPRAGNHQFSRDAERRLDKKLSRIVNGSDLIVGVPFVWMGYDHTREYLHYGKGGLISRRVQAPGQRRPLMTSLKDPQDRALLSAVRGQRISTGDLTPGPAFAKIVEKECGVSVIAPRRRLPAQATHSLRP